MEGRQLDELLASYLNQVADGAELQSPEDTETPKQAYIRICNSCANAWMVPRSSLMYIVIPVAIYWAGFFYDIVADSDGHIAGISVLVSFAVGVPIVFRVITSSIRNLQV